MIYLLLYPSSLLLHSCSRLRHSLPHLQVLPVLPRHLPVFFFLLHCPLFYATEKDQKMHYNKLHLDSYRCTFKWLEEKEPLLRSMPDKTINAHLIFLFVVRCDLDSLTHSYVHDNIRAKIMCLQSNVKVSDTSDDLY